MIEHVPWCGSLYKEQGISRQRIAIVGYSHHHDPSDGPDHNGLTDDVIRSWMNKRFQNSFFPYVENYFDDSIGRDLWNRVLFFNALPDCVGTAAERFKTGSNEQRERAKPRFLKIIEKYRPHKVLVFTQKGWSTIPETREEKSDIGLLPLRPKALDHFTWGTYDANGHIVMAFGLRHPQGANRQLMREAVQHILQMPPATS
jgi:hypothetical protein